MEHLFLALLVIIMIGALASGFPVAFALPGSAIISIGLAAFFGYLFAGDSSAYFAVDGPKEWLTAGITNFRSNYWDCLLYTSPSPRDVEESRMPSSA